MEIEYATIGGARIAVVNNRHWNNSASTILASYANSSNWNQTTLDYNRELFLGGIPLSISFFLDPDAEPSFALNQITSFWALDTIENNNEQDPEIENLNPSNSEGIVIPTAPSDKTFVLKGNRLSASKKDNRYYFNIVKTGLTGNAENVVMFMGIQMAQGSQNELILNNSEYSMDDVAEFMTVRIGGQPLTAGRVENNYYLIVSPITPAEA
ncbi:MAG: hypothetical protein ACTSSP_00130 [Candidatus Asgardarchaeia archaeon]